MGRQLVAQNKKGGWILKVGAPHGDQHPTMQMYLEQRVSGSPATAKATWILGQKDSEIKNEGFSPNLLTELVFWTRHHYDSICLIAQMQPNWKLSDLADTTTLMRTIGPFSLASVKPKISETIVQMHDKRTGMLFEYDMSACGVLPNPINLTISDAEDSMIREYLKDEGWLNIRNL